MATAESRTFSRGARAGLALVVLASAVFGAVHLRYAVTRHENFYSRGDTACLNQVLQRTSEGQFYEAPYCHSVHLFYGRLPGQPSPPLPEDASFLGLHPNLIALPMAALYRVFPDIRLLFVVSAVAVSSGAVLAYLLAWKRLGRPVLAVGLAAAYLMHPAASSAIVLEYHPDQAFVPLFLGAVTALAFGRQWLFLGLALCALVTKESVAPIMVGLAVFVALWDRRYWRVAALLVGAAAAWWFVLFEVIIPRESLNGHYIFESLYGNRLGPNFREIAVAIVTNPRLFLEVLSTDENRQYLFDLHAPFGFLALLSPLTYPAQALANFANLVSSSPALKEMGHYATVPLAVTAWAAVEGAVVLRVVAGRALRSRPLVRLAVRPEAGAVFGILVVVLALALPVLAWDRDERAGFSLMREQHRGLFEESMFGHLEPVLACVGADDYFASIDQLVGHVEARRITWPGVANDQVTVAITPGVPGFAVSVEQAEQFVVDLGDAFNVYRLADAQRNIVLARRGTEVAACVEGVLGPPAAAPPDQKMNSRATSK